MVWHIEAITRVIVWHIEAITVVIVWHIEAITRVIVYCERESEWEIIECQMSNVSELYNSEEMLHRDEMMMKSALFKTNTMTWILIVLAHWNNSPRVGMSLHSDTFFLLPS